MKPTDYTLKEQLRLTDREIRHRQDLLYISKEDIDSLVAMKPVISEHVDTIVETFYENQVTVDEISRLIGDSDTLSRLKAHMRKYILDLFDGDYGADYVQSRLRIGLVHKRIGVTPKLYISAVKNLMTLLSGYLTEQGDCRLCNTRNGALDKLILFDLELVFDTYIHSLMDELERGKEDVSP